MKERETNAAITWGTIASIGVLVAFLGHDAPASVKVLCGALGVLLACFLWAKLEEL